jgi:serine/threonine protein kinase
MFNNILRGPLELPGSLSTQAKSIIVSLLNRNPAKRLGCGFGGMQEIKCHEFFNCIDWEEVILRKLAVSRPKL